MPSKTRQKDTPTRRPSLSSARPPTIKRRRLDPPPQSSQATLPFAPPPPAAAPPAPEATQLPPDATQQPPERETESTPSSDDLPEEKETLVARRYSIPAKERLLFEPNWQLLQGGKYRHRPRTKRSTGDSRISWIFKHGAEVEKVKSDGRFGGRYWVCKHCNDANVKQQPYGCRSTSSAAYHLLKAHLLGPHGPIKEPKQQQQQTLECLYSKVGSSIAELWQQKFVNWIVHDDITFHQAESPFLRDLLLHSSSSSEIEGLLPRANTVRAWILRAFKTRQVDVKASLQEARSRISISFDSWTAPNDTMLLGIVGHWIDKSNQLRHALLALTPLEGHSGEEDLAPALQQCIDYYSISNQLGAFQMDNAENNDTCLRSLAARYSIDTDEQRLRCFGHVVNLVVKALLFGEGLSAFKKELDGATDLNQYKVWRKKGAIGKLHNLVVYITRSGQRTLAFNKAQEEIADGVVEVCRTLRLQKDTGVRWNSVFKMIRRALKLEQALTLYCARWQRPKDSQYNLKDDILDQQDWEELRHFKELLKPFYIVTQRLEGYGNEGSYGVVWEVLPAFDYLFNKLAKFEEEVNAQPELFTDYYTSCISAGFIKLRQYYELTDRSSIYRAAVALHPGKRFLWFERQWTAQEGGHREVKAAKDAVRLLWRRHLDTLELSSDNLLPSLALVPSPPPALKDESEDDDYTAAFGSYVPAVSKDKPEDKEGELERFLRATLDISGYEERPLAWWQVHGILLYPTLAILAFSLFATPGMSAECERAFSQAKKMVTEERYHLKSDIIEADQCVKSWLRSGLVDGKAAFELLARTEPSPVTIDSE
jgi:hypothetical protein